MRRRLCFTVIASLGCMLAATAADFTELARRLPENSNAIGLIDVAGLVNSSVGKAGGWANKPELFNIPGSISSLALGGQFNPAAGLHEWRYGVAKLAKPVSMSALAKKYNGQVTDVANHAAVITANNMAVVELDNGMLGIQTSANRQDLTRWIRAGDASTTLVVGPYLRDAIKDNSAAQIRFAVDTTDLFDPQGVKRKLGQSPALANDPAKAEQIARAFSAMKGLVFSIRAGDDIRGTIRADFDADVSALDSVAMPLFQEIAREQGVWLADFEGWKAQVRGKSIYFEGNLTEAGLRQTMTMLMSFQHSMHSIQSDSDNSALDSAVAASKRYFNGTSNLIDDLKKQMKQLRSTKEFAYWYEHTARKIDQLPVVGVDEQLLLYGGTISDKLRAMGSSCRGQAIDVNKLTSYYRSSSTVSYSGGVGTAWGYGFGYATGGTYFNNNYADVDQQKAETVASAVQDRVKVWESIDQNSGQIRRAMSVKYQTEF